MEKYEERRPWGTFERFTHNEPSTVKIITVHAGEETSLQKHERRDEFWRVVAGSGSVVVGETTHDAGPGREFFVPRGMVHRIRGGGAEPLQILEIAFGEFDEADIIRLEDKYSRGEA